MKPGYLTSEFWIIACVIVVAMAGALVGKLPADVAGTVSTILAALWAVLRHYAKQTPEKTDDDFIDTIAPLAPKAPESHSATDDNGK